MFRKWLQEHDPAQIDWSGPLLPKANDRTFWNAVPGGDAITAAETHLGCDWPQAKATDYMAFKKDGDRMRQEGPHFIRRRALYELATGEILEHRGRFLPDLVNGLLAVCEETFWGVSAHYPDPGAPGNLPDAENCFIDLFAAETASGLALIYYTLYEELQAYCPEILRRLEYETERRILRPYSTHRDFHWMGYRQSVNNWNSWILSNVLTVFLLMESRRSVLTDAIGKMIYEIQNLYNTYPEDGGCNEGSVYWSHSGGTLFEFCEQLYLASRGAVSFFEDGKLQAIGRYIYHSYIGNGQFVNYADSGRYPRFDYGMIYAFGRRIGDSRMTGLAGSLLQSLLRETDGEALDAEKEGLSLKRSLYALVCRPELAAEAPYVAEETVFLPNLQTACVRAGGWFAGVKGGHNAEGHNHNDVGNFIVYRDGAPVLADAGGGTYTRWTFSARRYEIWSMQSSWHNCPDVNGFAQPAGVRFRAGEMRLDGKTVTVRFEAAYPEEAGLVSLVRQVTAEEDGIVIRDRFVFGRPGNRICQNLITPQPVTVGEAQEAAAASARIGTEWVLEAIGEADARLTAETDRTDFAGDRKLIRVWKTDCMRRIRITAETDGTELVTVLRLKKAAPEG